MTKRIFKYAMIMLIFIILAYFLHLHNNKPISTSVGNVLNFGKGNIFSMLFVDNILYFIINKDIYKYDPNTAHVISIYHFDRPLSNLYKYNNDLLVGSLSEYMNESCLYMINLAKDRKDRLSCFSGYSEDIVDIAVLNDLIITAHQTGFLRFTDILSHKIIKEIKITDYELYSMHLKDNQLYCGGLEEVLAYDIKQNKKNTLLKGINEYFTEIKKINDYLMIFSDKRIYIIKGETIMNIETPGKILDSYYLDKQNILLLPTINGKVCSMDMSLLKIGKCLDYPKNSPVLRSIVADKENVYVGSDEGTIWKFSLNEILTNSY